MSKSC